MTKVIGDFCDTYVEKGVLGSKHDHITALQQSNSNEMQGDASWHQR